MCVVFKNSTIPRIIDKVSLYGQIMWLSTTTNPFHVQPEIAEKCRNKSLQAIRLFLAWMCRYWAIGRRENGLRSIGRREHWHLELAKAAEPGHCPIIVWEARSPSPSIVQDVIFIEPDKKFIALESLEVALKRQPLPVLYDSVNSEDRAACMW